MRRATGTFLTLLLLLASFPQPSRAEPSRDALIANLRKHVKYVFVIYQENRSFDSYFGTYPGAENLASRLAQDHGFRQYDPLGGQWVSPYRIADPDVIDDNHSRASLIEKVDGGAMDHFIADEESRALAAGKSTELAHRLGLLTMAHEDCDTVPYLWKYARAFALYDHFFKGCTVHRPRAISISLPPKPVRRWRLALPKRPWRRTVPCRANRSSTTSIRQAARIIMASQS